MMHPTKNQQSLAEIIVEDRCGITKFYTIADTLSNSFGVYFLNQIDDAHVLNWDFRYKNQLLTLHYNIFRGVAIFSQNITEAKKEAKAVFEIATFFAKRA